MKQGLDVEKAKEAFKRAAYKATHGTREERSGRFLPKGDHRPATTPKGAPESRVKREA
jgi:hypothetical protein